MMKNNRFSHHSLALAISGAISLSAVNANAQTDMPQTADSAPKTWAIEEVMVTAQKRPQTLQDVPIAVSSFSGTFLKDANMKDAKAISVLTPGVSGDSDDSFLDTINIRGVVTNDFGVGAEPSVGIYQDGVYLGRTGGAVTSFFDVAGVEVVKGPQGTLFGRNSSAGAISTTTQKPTDAFEGSVNVGIGENDYNTFTGVINVPLSDRFAVRAAYYHEEEDGWIKNLEGGNNYGQSNIDAGRVSFRYFGDTTDVTLSLEYEDRQQDGSIYNVTNTNVLPNLTEWNSPGKYGEVASDLGNDSVDEGEVWGATLTIEKDLGNDYLLTSITGIRGHNYTYAEDFDGSSYAIDHYYQDQQQKYYSQEFRLNYNGDGPVTWFVGASAYKEELEAQISDFYDEDQQCNFTAAYYYSLYNGASVDASSYGGCASYYYFSYYGVGSGPGAGYVGETREVDAEYDGWGVYGDATWHATDALDVTVGLRYTRDNRDFGLWAKEQTDHNYPSIFTSPAYTDGFIEQSDTWDNWSPRIAVNWYLTPDISVYGNVSSGYKAGGFNSSALDFKPGFSGKYYFYEALNGGSTNATDTAILSDFDSETVTNFEVGMKSSWWDDRLNFNASLYHYTFDDYQVNYFDVDARKTVVANAGDAEGTGLEMDIRVLPIENLDVYFGVSFMDTELTKIKQGNICETDCVGNKLPGSVDVSYAMVATYTIPTQVGDWRLTVENFYQDDAPVDFDDATNMRIDGFNKVNLRVGFESNDGWSANLYVENATDEEYYKGAANYDYSIGYHDFGPARGRFVGLDVGYSF